MNPFVDNFRDKMLIAVDSLWITFLPVESVEKAANLSTGFRI